MKTRACRERIPKSSYETTFLYLPVIALPNFLNGASKLRLSVPTLSGHCCQLLLSLCKTRIKILIQSICANHGHVFDSNKTKVLA